MSDAVKWIKVYAYRATTWFLRWLTRRLGGSR